MPLAKTFTHLIADLQRIEQRSASRGERVFSSHGAAILQAFLRHAGFEAGAIFLREPGDSALRLSAHRECVAPEMLAHAGFSDDVVRVTSDLSAGFDPHPELMLPLRSSRDSIGVIALARPTIPSAISEDAVDMLRAAAAFASSIMNNHRLVHEMREGDFQLKYRLWELESLYDIGLSIASTLNIDDLAEEILTRMISLTNARRAALFLREGTRFALYRSFGDVSGAILDEQLAQQLMQEGKPLTFEENQDCVFPDCASFVALPIEGSSGVIGVLAAADRETREGGIGAFEANDLRLLSLFASQAAIALENARLHRAALEKQAMERELELAATIQRDILPKTIPVIEGLDLATFANPARQVGGDYHAFFPREDELALVIADVSGKSIPAALLVSALHAALQLLFAERHDLGEIATELNRHIHNWSAENKFITMILASIDSRTETVRYVNAGHNPGYLIHDGQLEMIKSHGLPIGIMGQTRYTTHARPFTPGSSIVLYTDGITEAENVEGEEFENDRLEVALRATLTATSAEIRDRIAADVQAFVGEAAQKDDQTMVVIRSLPE
jgi:sigma-B regulation protein RsbU (phosphoserine phosphatase)